MIMNIFSNIVYMVELDNNIRCSLSIYVIFCMFLYTSRPSVMFDSSNNFKEFGLTNDKTIYPFWLVSIIGGLFIHYIVLLLNTNYV
jgi:hypothetical protein